MQYVTDAQEFYKLLKKEENFVKIDNLTDSQVAELLLFCYQNPPKTIFEKMSAVNKLVKGLVKSGLIPKIKVKFNLFGKGLASMFDRGEIVFYKQFLFNQAYLESVVTVIHEIAHVYLWSSKDYCSLKECDADFLNKYVTDQSQTVLCPIEYYANETTISWLEQTLLESQNSKATQLLRDNVQRLQEKLNVAKQKI